MVQDQITNVNPVVCQTPGITWKPTTTSQLDGGLAFQAHLPNGSFGRVWHYLGRTGESGWLATCYIHINEQTNIILSGGETFVTCEHAQQWCEQYLTGRVVVQFYPAVVTLPSTQTGVFHGER